jgi:outer membrane protein assembly factor BamB
MLSALAVGDLVFTRTARGVAAFDLETGGCRWRHPSDDDDENAGLDRIIWQEAGGGAFSADDESVYLLEEMRVVASESAIPGQGVLSAREHFGGRQGNLRWQVGGPDGGAEPRLAGALFLGPPLCYHDRLYVLLELKRVLSLAVLDRATGRRDWTQDLAQIEEAVPDDKLRLLGGATPSISSEEIIVCPTSGGAVVALDLPTQSLLWAYRYARKAPGPAAENELLDGVPRLDQFDRWLDATASIGNGCVVLAPPESRQIHCLDLKTGQPKWTKPRGDGMLVGCLTSEHAVILGRRQLTALRLADGAAAWTHTYRNKALPAGRGVLAGQRYFLPMTSAAILEIDLATGTLAAEHKSPRELPAGNLIWHKGLFLSQGPFALDAFDEREWLVAHVHEQLERDPRDPDALVRRGELEVSAGRITEAIAAFRAAHESAHSAKTRVRLVSALLEAVRLKLPESEKFAAELDDLIGP